MNGKEKRNAKKEEMLAVLNNYGEISQEQTRSVWGSIVWVYHLKRATGRERLVSRGYTHALVTDSMYRYVLSIMENEVQALENEGYRRAV